MNNKLFTNLKKVTGFALALLVVVSSFGFAVSAKAAGVPTVTIGSQSAVNGANISVPVDASNFANTVAGMTFEVQYDPTLLTYTGYTANPLLTGGLQVGTSANTVNFNYFSLNPLTIDTANLLTLNFTVVSATSTTANLTFPAVTAGNPGLFDSTAAQITTAVFTTGAITLNAASPAKAITAFNFTTPIATGVINEPAKTVAVTVPFGTNVTALIPTIAISGSSISPASGVAQNFTSPVVYTVTAADASTQPYTVTVTIAPSATLSNAPAATTTVTSINITVGGGVSYTYSLDAGAMSASTPIATPITATGLALGAHTLSVVVTDGAGNTQTLTANWTIVAYSISALSGTPTNPTSATTLNVTVGGTGVVSYQYSLDAGSLSAVTPIATPITATGLAAGAHTLSVYGIDSLGTVQPTATTFNWTIVTALPTAVLSGTPTNPTSATTLNVTVGGTGVVSYQYSLDAGALSAITPIATPITATGLTSGSHTLSVYGIDAANNVQTAATVFTWTISTTLPVAVLTGTPTNPTNVTVLNVTVGGTGVVSYQYSLDAGALSAVTPIATPITATGLALGAHTLSVYGIDVSNNVQTTATTFAWTITAVLPTAVLSGTPAAVTNATSIDITVGGTGVASYTYSLDAGAMSASTPIATHITATGLALGAHTLSVLATDGAGNVQTVPTTFTWTISTIAATLTGTPTNPTNVTTLNVTVGGTGVVSYQYTLDAGVLSAVTPIATPITATGLANGSHTLSVYGIDAINNVQVAATVFTWTVDTVLPVIAITSPIAAATVNNSTPIVFTDNETTSPQCSIDQTNWVACVSGTTNFGNLTGYNALALASTLTLYVKDTDVAGNTGTASVASLVKGQDTYAYSFTLNNGWNLISMGVDPANNAIGSILGSAAANVVSVWAYDSTKPAGQEWSVYHPNSAATSNLSTMLSGYGYWVNYSGAASATVSGNGNLFVAGNTTPPSRQLKAGWNLIGYYEPSNATTSPVLTALKSLEAPANSNPYWTMIAGYSAGAFVNNPTSIDLGKGYWISLGGLATDTYLYSPAF